jgi:phytoene dehydrogenase-like protein
LGDYDAVVVGSGPNGLSAGVTLAQAGMKVLLIEGHEHIGGGTRTDEVTLPGFRHDLCSAIHPFAQGSPFFRQLPLAEHGMELVHPPVPVAHPLDGGGAAALLRSLQQSAARFGADGRAYAHLMGPLVEDWADLTEDLLGPLGIPRRPLLFARFGLSALRSAAGLATSRFRGEPARALVAGLAAHSMLPLDSPATAAIALVEAMLAHTAGWPMVRGGSQNLAHALGAIFTSLGGEICTSRWVRDVGDIPEADVTVFDLTPRQLLEIKGLGLQPSYRRQLRRFRYGPGVFKVDWALDGTAPWKAEICAQAGTVHLGGTLEEIRSSEAAVWEGLHPERPFVIYVQQSQFDPTRAPKGKHTAWAYCHVPSGSRKDMTAHIEAQIERFAPGFRDRILARHTMNSQEMEDYNPNYVGGDINGGVQDIRQLFTRPVPRLNPYVVPGTDSFLCSSSTPPGGGVHGMCGYHAARSALKRVSR